MNSIESKQNIIIILHVIRCIIMIIICNVHLTSLSYYVVVAAASVVDGPGHTRSWRLSVLVFGLAACCSELPMRNDTLSAFNHVLVMFTWYFLLRWHSVFRSRPILANFRITNECVIRNQ